MSEDITENSNIGTSSSCEPCRRGAEEHEKRHREIAELVHKLKEFKLAEAQPASPLSPKAPNLVAHQWSPAGESPLTKKERKAVKKAKRVSEMPKVVSGADVDHVARVLHPDGHNADDAEDERRLLEDPDIKLNRCFHKGTSNKREIRNELVKKERHSSNAEVHVEPEQINGILQLLDVSPAIALTGTPEEKRIVESLKQKIEKDLVQMQKESEQTMMRKGGFWRWASKKAYIRLVQNGRIWGQKSSDGIVQKINEIEAANEPDTNLEKSAVAGAPDSVEGTEADTGITAPLEDGLATTTSKLSIDFSPKVAMTSSPVDDGWTKVGCPSKLKKFKPVGNLKLMHNGGLAKLVQSPKAKRDRFSTFFLDETEL